MARKIVKVHSCGRLVEKFDALNSYLIESFFSLIGSSSRSYSLLVWCLDKDGCIVFEPIDAIILVRFVPLSHYNLFYRARTYANETFGVLLFQLNKFKTVVAKYFGR